MKQQEESLERSLRYHVSLTTITYVHLFVQSGPHSAAVQITINPFSLENYPKQTFFHSKYRYGLCCGKAPQDTVATTVKERVQKVYDAFYLPGYWDFSYDQYVTADHFNTSNESCLHATNSMLCEYIQSAHIIVPISEGLVSNPAAYGASEPSLVSECSLRSNQANRTRSHRTCTDEGPLPANDDYDANDAQLTQSTTQGNSEHDKSQIQILAEAAAVKVQRGLKNIKNGDEDTDILPQMPYDQRDLYDKAKHLGELLWVQASHIKTAATRAKWSRRFLASCFSMICKDLRADSQPIIDLKRKDWLVAAEIINSIVNRLLKIWGWKAFLLYPALECYYFVRWTRLEKKKRRDAVSALVEILRNEVPTVACPQVLLDPAFFIGYALNMDSDSGKQFYTGADRELENERTYSAFPSRKRKAGAESESTFSTPYQIKKLATGAFLSGSDHRCEKTSVSNPEDHQFPQDVVPSLPGPHLPIPSCEPTVDANPIGSNNNSISIDALLNPVGLTQGQQLSPVANSWFTIGGETGLNNDEQNTASENAGVYSSKIQNRGLDCQSQTEANSPPNKRRRINEFSSHDSFVPQSPNQTPGDANSSVASQTCCAHQPIDAIEENNIGGIQAMKEQREIELIFDNALIEKLDSKLEGVFHNPLIARYQNYLERSRQSVILMVPNDAKQNCTFSITIDRVIGYEIIKQLDLQHKSSQERLEQYSNMPKEKLPLLGNYLHQGIIRTQKFKSELGPRCTCIHAFATDGMNDVTFSMMFDRDWGYSLRDMFGMQKMEIRF
ncbi:hypothetical protein H4I96_12058 [Botrytis cinerea]